MALIAIPPTEGVKDRGIRSVLEAMKNNLDILAGRFSSTATQRAMTVQDLIDIGIVGLDRGALYSKVNTIARELQDAQTQGSGAGGGVSSGGTVASSDEIHVYSARATFDVGGGKAVAEHSLGVALPIGAVVTWGMYSVETALTGGAGAQLALGIDADDEYAFVPLLPIADPAWSVGRHQALLHKPLGSPPYSEKCTAARNLIASVSGAALTAGRVVVWVQYVVIE